MEKTPAEIISELTKGITTLIDKNKKCQKEIIYAIERLKNLNAIVNSSKTDLPRELVKNWIDETITELLQMENINPEKIGK